MPGETECPVCFGRLACVIAARPPCGHEVCLPCLMALRKRDCVICRADLSSFFPPPRCPRVTLHVSGDHVQIASLPSPPTLLQSIQRAVRESGAEAERPSVPLHE